MSYLFDSFNVRSTGSALSNLHGFHFDAHSTRYGFEYGHNQSDIIGSNDKKINAFDAATGAKKNGSFLLAGQFLKLPSILQPEFSTRVVNCF